MRKNLETNDEREDPEEALAAVLRLHSCQTRSLQR